VKTLRRAHANVREHGPLKRSAGVVAAIIIRIGWCLFAVVVIVAGKNSSIVIFKEFKFKLFRINFKIHL
jgi:hypothetical protein